MPPGKIAIPAASLLLFAIACVIGGEPAAGGTRAGGGENSTAKKLPWPDPDAKDVEKLKTELRGQLPAAIAAATRVAI